MDLDEALAPVAKEHEMALRMVCDMTEGISGDLGTGKGIRAGLFLLCSQAGGHNVPQDHRIRIASSIELIHLASLIHDDVVDSSSLRRGKPTVNGSFGEEYAVAAGDAILAKAAGIIGDVAPDGAEDRKGNSDVTTQQSARGAR